jgi:hypothetical protein
MDFDRYTIALLRKPTWPTFVKPGFLLAAASDG